MSQSKGREGQGATRRGVIAGGLALAAGAPALAADSPPSPLTLWYGRPAQAWVEALPVGSGRIGAMVFGGVAEERLQLNEDTLWGGGPYDPSSPEALEALPKVRALLDEGRYAEATELAQAKMMARPIRQMSYLSAGDLLLSFQGTGETSGYRRSLDLDEAIARTRFGAGDFEHRRSVYASAADQVIVVELSAQPGGLSFDLTYAHARNVKPADAPSAGAMRTETAAVQSPPTPRPKTLTVGADGPSALLIQGRNTAQNGIEAALGFAVRVAVQAEGGSVVVEGERLSVRGARTAALIVAIATSYRRYDDVSGDPVADVRARTAAAQAKGLRNLRRGHLAEHRRLFRAVDLQLGSTAAAARPTDERVKRSLEVDDPALAALYFQFGRYLLLGCSRPGGQPANLQGLWNEGLNPPWGGKYTININTQMNYWPAEPTALGECVEPLVRMIEDIAVTGARTARVNYGARGWVAHHNTDLWRATAPIDGAKFGLWPTGGAWLCRHLWDRWDYGRDRAFLARAYPLMKGASLFFLDTLVNSPKGLITSPSLSPENTHQFGTSVCAGPAMDRQILRDLFEQTAAAAAILDLDPEFRAQVLKARSNLAADQVGGEGQLQEWLEDWDAGAKDLHHRHVSHLYGLYPSEQINVRGTPALAAAARKSLETRGDEATGWGIGWRLNLWARLGQGDHAHKVLRTLTGPERTYPNLFDAHPPFQIDGNFGGSAGIAEMLLQCWGGELHILPALPSAWPQGAVRGLKARGGFTADIFWREGRLERLTLIGKPGETARLRYGGKAVEAVIPKHGRAVLGPGLV